MLCGIRLECYREKKTVIIVALIGKRKIWERRRGVQRRKTVKQKFYAKQRGGSDGLEELEGGESSAHQKIRSYSPKLGMGNT